MKRVRITIDPPDAYLPPVYVQLTREAPYLSDVEIINWNVAEPPVGFLLFVRGAYQRVEPVLENGENVRDFELFPNGESEAYCFLATEQSTVGRALFENCTRHDLLTVPPVTCHDDGRSTFTLIGTDAAIQAAIDGVPEGVAVTVEAVGTEPVTQQNIVAELSPQQRAAIEAALQVGYYAVPRTASVDDVARELECARATASEHLRKAEATVLSRLFNASSG